MIWGLEGRHEWDGVITLNRRIDDAGDLVLPRYKLDRIGGLQSSGDAEDVRELAVGREGEIPRRSFRRGKTITYEGVTQAATLADLRAAEAALRAAFDNQRVEKFMVVTPHPTYDGSGASRFFRARALAVEDFDEQGEPWGIAHGFERPFVVSVRASDRRYYDGELKSTSITVVDAADSDTGLCVNGGTVDTDPVLTVTSTRGATSWPAVDVATAAALPAFAAVGGSPYMIRASADGSLMIDGVFVDNTMSVLVKDEVANAQFNGLWDVLSPGGPENRWELTRRADADATGEFAAHKQVAVLGGAVNGGRTFEQSTVGAITVNTTPIAFGPLLGAVGLVISSDTVGAALVFPTLQILAGDELVIDFRTRQITFNGVLQPGILDSASDWWDAGVAGLVAGNNTIRVSSYTGTAGGFDVTCMVAWWDAFV